MVWDGLLHENTTYTPDDDNSLNSTERQERPKTGASEVEWG